MSYLKEAGFEFTLEEVKALTSELTDEMLDQVSGGIAIKTHLSSNLSNML